MNRKTMEFYKKISVIYSSESPTQHLKFLKLAGTGVNVFVSNRDAGSNPDNTGHSPTGPVQAERPSSDPFVIGVGGTSLTLSALGDVASEIAWPSSGGGKSIYFQRPSWQTGTGIPLGSMRLVPDVSLTADPDLGAYIFFQGAISYRHLRRQHISVASF